DLPRELLALLRGRERDERGPGAVARRADRRDLLLRDRGELDHVTLLAGRALERRAKRAEAVEGPQPDRLALADRGDGDRAGVLAGDAAPDLVDRDEAVAAAAVVRLGERAGVVGKAEAAGASDPALRVAGLVDADGGVLGRHVLP